jgi:hypothetical protein
MEQLLSPTLTPNVNITNQMAYRFFIGRVSFYPFDVIISQFTAKGNSFTAASTENPSVW